MMGLLSLGTPDEEAGNHNPVLAITGGLPCTVTSHSALGVWLVSFSLLRMALCTAQAPSKLSSASAGQVV